ncbi:MAG TPA: helix-turn-helix domain-containing protein [Planctomycetes bacterium]|nr:helix-turn-helix domain-containing protein [Planctomycetota bacterium]
MNTDTKLYTYKEVSDFTGIKVNTLQKWRHVGKGPVWSTYGRLVRCTPANLRKWIEQAWTPSNQREL